MWRDTETAYGLVSRCLHSSVAAIFIGQIALGFLTRATAADPALQFALYQWHKSFGFLILGLGTLRLIWFAASRHPLPCAGTPPLMAAAAHAVARLLLALTVLVPLAGWAVVSSSPLDIPSYVFDLFVMPNLPLTVSDAAEAFWSDLHAVLAYSAGILVALHAGAAFYHHIVRRDETLRRMLGLTQGGGHADSKPRHGHHI